MKQLWQLKAKQNNNNNRSVSAEVKGLHRGDYRIAFSILFLPAQLLEIHPTSKHYTANNRNCFSQIFQTDIRHLSGKLVLVSLVDVTVMNFSGWST